MFEVKVLYKDGDVSNFSGVISITDTQVGVTKIEYGEYDGIEVENICTGDIESMSITTNNCVPY